MNMVDLSTARFQLTNLTERVLSISVSQPEWRTLEGTGARQPVAIKRVLVAGIEERDHTKNAATITLQPKVTVPFEFVVDGAPPFAFDTGYTYEATFWIDGASVRARSGDKYFRAPDIRP